MAAWRHAYDELVTGRYPALVAYASLLTASDIEAEAVTRAALVRVFGRLRPPSNAEAAETAVRREIVTKAASARRGLAAGRRRAAQAVPDQAERETAAEGDGEARGRSEAAGRLRALDPVTRACVVLRHAATFVADVADRLRISPDDVRARLGRGRGPYGRPGRRRGRRARHHDHRDVPGGRRRG